MNAPVAVRLAAPTEETYAELQAAFAHFNRELFDGRLELPLFTLQRERRTFGYSSPQRFVSRHSGEMVDEIAMNPAYFSIRTIKKTLSTLVHEMVHQWQFHYGKPGRRGYHNTEWANKMESVGLMPSQTGEEGGRRVGEQVTHYIIKGGAFDVACDALLTTEFTLSWLDRYPAERPATFAPLSPVAAVVEPLSEPGAGEPEPGATGTVTGDDGEMIALPRGLVLPPAEPVNRSNRVKYLCGECKAQAWGKPGLVLLCGGRVLEREGDTISNTHSPVTMRAVQFTGASDPV